MQTNLVAAPATNHSGGLLLKDSGSEQDEHSHRMLSLVSEEQERNTVILVQPQ